MTSNYLQDTANWFKTAFPNPDSKNTSTQIGVLVEEVTEMLDALNIDCYDLKTIAEDLKHGVYREHLQTVLSDENSRLEFLDSLADITVTTVGSAHVTNMDLLGALNEVNKSNFSKFDGKGKPIYNKDTGKVMKGDLYFKPNLKKYTQTQVK